MVEAMLLLAATLRKSCALASGVSQASRSAGRSIMTGRMRGMVFELACSKVLNY